MGSRQSKLYSKNDDKIHDKIQGNKPQDHLHINMVRDLFKLYTRKQAETSKYFGLTDSDCEQLIQLYFSSNQKVGNLPLHACVNSPPCNSDETELTLYNRKWCKGTKSIIGSKEFDAKAMKIQETILQHRLERLTNIPDTEKTEAAKTIKALKGMGSSNFNTSDIPSEEDLIKRIAALDKDEINNPKSKYIEQIKTEVVRSQIRLENKESSLEVLTLTRNVVKSTSDAISNEHKKTKKEDKENKESIKQANDNILSALESLNKVTSQLSSDISSARQEITELKKQNEYLSRAARTILGEQLWSDTLNGLINKGPMEL